MNKRKLRTQKKGPNECRAAWMLKSSPFGEAQRNLPGKALECCRLRVDAKRHSARVQLVADEFVHFLCETKTRIRKYALRFKTYDAHIKFATTV
jgi:hypothetical protein